METKCTHIVGSDQRRISWSSSRKPVGQCALVCICLNTCLSGLSLLLCSDNSVSSCLFSPPVRNMASIGKFNEGKQEHKDGAFFLYIGDGNVESDLYVWLWFKLISATINVPVLCKYLSMLRLFNNNTEFPLYRKSIPV